MSFVFERGAQGVVIDACTIVDTREGEREALRICGARVFLCFDTDRGDACVIYKRQSQRAAFINLGVLVLKAILIPLTNSNLRIHSLQVA